MSSTHQHHPGDHASEPRDPIMKDDHFSLRYGNPIQVIHDRPKPHQESFEPSKDHAPVTISPIINTTSNLEPPKESTIKKAPSFERDCTSFAEFVHKGGVVSEIDH
ncbi:hypothetical protein LRAMOSA10140 [Lichtheimia ramosa]|uniref:Uncharacterized protein n=1 Tax=Lichtheimia ramosa TaxID=688394 RepID=A0A077WNV8_9FUNG|nr:hypothetical protein LRAMOSA10140 [Lichtheimia ramosa]